MAFSGSQITRLGASGISRPLYGSFASKSTVVVKSLVADLASGYPGLPRTAASLPTIVDFCNRLLQGRLNLTGTLTLGTSTTATTLKDPRIGPSSFIWLMPQTANAKAALPDVYITDRTKGQATINHASSANADQTFTCLIIG